ncbi:DUF1648 domain-containing protein [Candidatus Uabimicrobium amorphum]|uniref:DUF1648 domain-containing protein n=1 Tax=Uabimicrobium amorphum TaxID=2596890 RepID=A0A5S9INJ0_UABAM|nr:DUF1648 domain-containing protein [Candidatus Uabimicrobium amorphum]BBM84801.1 hypothetical protein UABAM_03162 [Candidatus Uabimicrobium amorphum]
MLNLFRLLWCGLFVALIVQVVNIYPNLPEQIAIHFDIQGQADGFGDKQTFYTILAIIIAFMNLMFLSLSLLIKKIPASIVNIPWKDYWFANEERQEIAYRKLKEVLAMTGVLINGICYLLNIIILRSSTVCEACPTGDFIQSNFVWITLSCAAILVILMFVIVKPPKD